MSIRKVIFVVLAALTLASCGSEFKLAKKFVSQSPKILAAVYFPEAAEVSLIADSDGTYSRVLDSVSQDLFLDLVYAAYAEELGLYGVGVYVPDDPDRVKVDSLNWLVILSKMEIQGLYTDYVDHLFYFDDEYDYSFALNTVNVASWFDVNDGEWHPTQYDEYNLRDDFSSNVTRSRANGTQYHYNIIPLRTEDVYDYAVFLGRRYAAFTYNYMMNRYVESGLRLQNRLPRFKLRWDSREKSYFYQFDNEGFVGVE